MKVKWLMRQGKLTQMWQSTFTKTLYYKFVWSFKLLIQNNKVNCGHEFIKQHSLARGYCRGPAEKKERQGLIPGCAIRRVKAFLCVQYLLCYSPMSEVTWFARGFLMSEMTLEHTSLSLSLGCHEPIPHDCENCQRALLLML